MVSTVSILCFHELCRNSPTFGQAVNLRKLYFAYAQQKVYSKSQSPKKKKKKKSLLSILQAGDEGANPALCRSSVPSCYNAKDKNRQQANISFCAFCSFTNWALSVHRWEKHKRGKKDQRQLGRLDRQLLLEQWYKRSKKKKKTKPKKKKNSRGGETKMRVLDLYLLMKDNEQSQDRESNMSTWVKQDEKRCQGKKSCVKQEAHRQMWSAERR